MPINPDGTITAAPTEGQRYTTRYLIEFTYTADSPLRASLTHALLVGLLDSTLDQADHDALPELGLEIHTTITAEPLVGDRSSVLHGAKRNPPPGPEGGDQEGGSVVDGTR